MRVVFFTVGFILSIVFHIVGQQTFVFDQTNTNTLIGKNLFLLVDETHKLGLQDVIQSKEFTVCNNQVPNLGIGTANYWLKFKILNTTDETKLMVGIPYAVLDSIDFYEVQGNSVLRKISVGDNYLFGQRKFLQTDFLFDIELPTDSQKTFFVKISSGEQIIVPVMVGTEKNVLESSAETELIFGIYLGIVMAMALYNLFLFFIVGDKSYLYYVVYFFFISLTQATIFGYPFKYLWPNAPVFSNHTLIIFPALAGLSAIQFTRHFLKTKYYTPRLNKGLNLFAIAYLGAVLISYLDYPQLSFKIIDFTGLSISIYCLAFTIIIVRKGFYPAKYFLIAWSVFLCSVIVYVLRNLGILPYNDFTNYSILFGTSFETITLSIALAARINDLKRDKEISQARIVEALMENERIVKEQNITLERNVQKRTEQLSKTNTELSVALESLKAAQIQLVESEKMASLGQLTAGIAHEINNPINFVTSSVVPLKRDIDFILKIVEKYEVLHESFLEEKLQEVMLYKKKVDFEYLKEEINIILEGIEEGASRTAEIIRGLRNFSRLDEGGLKKVDIHSGIDSTLVLLNSSVRDKITIVKNYGNIPVIECLAGKLNQVFMNLLSNAIHAVTAQHNGSGNGQIFITTWEIDNQIAISIKDNGTGMSEETKNKIFDPFFTTKGINEGTGLGLSIVQSAIDSHHAKMIIKTELGIGTEFIIYLPINNF